MESPYTYVRRAVLDIHLPESLHNQGYEDVLRDALLNEIQEIINTEIAARVPEDKHFAIDQLAVDIGPVKAETSKADFIERFRKAFGDALSRSLVRAEEKNDRNEFLLFFLENGTYPWWAPQEQPLRLGALLNALSADDYDRFILQLKSILGKTHVQQRLGSQLNANELKKIIAALSGTDVQQLLVILERVSRVFQSAASEKELLSWLLTEMAENSRTQPGEQETVVRFIRENAAAAAATPGEAGILLAKLQRELLEAVPAGAVLFGAAEAALFTALPEEAPFRREAETDGTFGDESTQDPLLQLLAYFTRYGSLPPGAATVAGFLALLAEPVARERVYARRLFRRLPSPWLVLLFSAAGESESRKIFEALFPAETEVPGRLKKGIQILLQHEALKESAGSAEILSLAAAAYGLLHPTVQRRPVINLLFIRPFLSENKIPAETGLDAETENAFSPAVLRIIREQEPISGDSSSTGRNPDSGEPDGNDWRLKQLSEFARQGTLPPDAEAKKEFLARLAESVERERTYAQTLFRRLPSPWLVRLFTEAGESDSRKIVEALFPAETAVPGRLKKGIEFMLQQETLKASAGNAAIFSLAAAAYGLLHPAAEGLPVIHLPFIRPFLSGKTIPDITAIDPETAAGFSPELINFLRQQETITDGTNRKSEAVPPGETSSVDPGSDNEPDMLSGSLSTEEKKDPATETNPVADPQKESAGVAGGSRFLSDLLSYYLLHLSLPWWAADLRSLAPLKLTRESSDEQVFHAAHAFFAAKYPAEYRKWAGRALSIASLRAAVLWEIPEEDMLRMAAALLPWRSVRIPALVGMLVEISATEKKKNFSAHSIRDITAWMLQHASGSEGTTEVLLKAAAAFVSNYFGLAAGELAELFRRQYPRFSQAVRILPAEAAFLADLIDLPDNALQAVQTATATEQNKFLRFSPTQLAGIIPDLLEAKATLFLPVNKLQLREAFLLALAQDKNFRQRTLRAWQQFPEHRRLLSPLFTGAAMPLFSEAFEEAGQAGEIAFAARMADLFGRFFPAESGTGTASRLLHALAAAEQSSVSGKSNEEIVRAFFHTTEPAPDPVSRRGRIFIRAAMAEELQPEWFARETETAFARRREKENERAAVPHGFSEWLEKILSETADILREITASEKSGEVLALLRKELLRLLSEITEMSVPGWETEKIRELLEQAAATWLQKTRTIFFSGQTGKKGKDKILQLQPEEFSQELSALLTGQLQEEIENESSSTGFDSTKPGPGKVDEDRLLYQDTSSTVAPDMHSESAAGDENNLHSAARQARERWLAAWQLLSGQILREYAQELSISDDIKTKTGTWIAAETRLLSRRYRLHAKPEKQRAHLLDALSRLVRFIEEQHASSAAVLQTPPVKTDEKASRSQKQEPGAPGPDQENKPQGKEDENDPLRSRTGVFISTLLYFLNWQKLPWWSPYSSTAELARYAQLLLKKEPAMVHKHLAELLNDKKLAESISRLLGDQLLDNDVHASVISDFTSSLELLRYFGAATETAAFTDSLETAQIIFSLLEEDATRQRMEAIIRELCSELIAGSGGDFSGRKLSETAADEEQTERLLQYLAQQRADSIENAGGSQEADRGGDAGTEVTAANEETDPLQKLRQRINYLRELLPEQETAPVSSAVKEDALLVQITEIVSARAIPEFLFAADTDTETKLAVAIYYDALLSARSFRENLLKSLRRPGITEHLLYPVLLTLQQKEEPIAAGPALLAWLAAAAEKTQAGASASAFRIVQLLRKSGLDDPRIADLAPAALLILLSRLPGQAPEKAEHIFRQLQQAAQGFLPEELLAAISGAFSRAEQSGTALPDTYSAAITQLKMQQRDFRSSPDETPAGKLARTLMQAMSAQPGLLEAWSKLPPEHEPAELKPAAAGEENAAAAGEPLFIFNAGLVIFWPFIGGLLRKLQYVRGREFVSPGHQQRAVYLLHCLADQEERNPPEHLLALNKLFCGLDPSAPLTTEERPDEKERAEAGLFVASVKAQWPEMKNTAVETFLRSFIRREGMLLRKDDNWELQVQRTAIDVLLKKLPWGFSTVKFPWTPGVIFVKWKI